MCSCSEVILEAHVTALCDTCKRYCFGVAVLGNTCISICNFLGSLWLSHQSQNALKMLQINVWPPVIANKSCEYSCLHNLQTCPEGPARSHIY